jgi:hypothetical protein
VSRKNLTPQSIERQRPPASGRAEHRDAVVPGLVLRITALGARSFCVRYRVHGEGGASANGRLRGGREHRVTLATLDLKEARAQARKIIEAATEGRDARVERRENAPRAIFQSPLSANIISFPRPPL